MVEIVVIVVLLIVNYFIFSFVFYRRRFPPLFNIVLGKATFESLSVQLKQQVESHALEIINRTWAGKDFRAANLRMRLTGSHGMR